MSEYTQGQKVFNYYDRYVVIIGEQYPDGWFDTTREDGSRGPMLNDERVCSLEVAKAKGWL